MFNYSPSLENLNNNNNNSTVPNLEGQFGDYISYAWRSMILACILILVSVVGIVGNAISIVIFTGTSMRSSINTLLAGLSTFDLVLLILVIPVFALPGMEPYTGSELLYNLQKYSLTIFYPLNMITQTGSVFTMVSIAVERWIAVCQPLKAKSLCTMAASRKCLIAIVTLATAYNIIRFWEYKLDFSTPSGYKVLLRDVNKYPVYNTLYFVILYLIINFMVPFSLLLYLNCHVVWTIFVARHQRAHLSHQQMGEHRTAIMMVIVILSFAFCNTMPFVLNIIELVKPDFFSSSNTFLLAFQLNDVCNFLVALNSATTFIIYLCFSQRYKKHFQMLFYPCMTEQNRNRLNLMASSSFPTSLITKQTLTLAAVVPRMRATTWDAATSKSQQSRSRSAEASPSWYSMNPNQKVCGLFPSTSASFLRSSSITSSKSVKSQYRNYGDRNCNQNLLTVPNGDVEVHCYVPSDVDCKCHKTGTGRKISAFRPESPILMVDGEEIVV